MKLHSKIMRILSQYDGSYDTDLQVAEQILRLFEDQGYRKVTLEKPTGGIE